MAYGMRISDWSSDVCSSDLLRVGGKHFLTRQSAVFLHENQRMLTPACHAPRGTNMQWRSVPVTATRFGERNVRWQRSEERRVGKECVSTCRSGWAPDHEKKNTTNTIKDI